MHSTKSSLLSALSIALVSLFVLQGCFSSPGSDEYNIARGGRSEIEARLTPVINLPIYSLFLAEAEKQENIVLRNIPNGSSLEKLRSGFQQQLSLGSEQLARQEKIFNEIFEGGNRRAWPRRARLRLKIEAPNTTESASVDRIFGVVTINFGALQSYRDWAVRRTYGDPRQFRRYQARLYEIYKSARWNSREYGTKTLSEVLTADEIRVYNASQGANTLFTQIIMFVLAHELGHHYLRHSIFQSGECNLDEEFEADAFAVVQMANFGIVTHTRTAEGQRVPFLAFQGRFAADHRLSNASDTCHHASSSRRTREATRVWNEAVRRLRERDR